MVTLEQLQKIMPYARKRAEVFLVPLNEAMHEFHINSPIRRAAFLAQIAVESGELRYVEEIASGAAYEGRTDLGNTQPGDGKKFKGRGPIQITGRANTRACSLALYGDERLLDTPELLEQPEDGCRAAGWFWMTRGLNMLADDGDFERITRRINGGTNGAAERRAYHVVAKRVLCSGAPN